MEELEMIGTKDGITEDTVAESSTESFPDTPNPEICEDIKDEGDSIDYEELERADMEELCSLFPNLRGKTKITELDNPLRYAALRDLGLTPKEAYLATSEPIQKYDNRSHLKSSVPRSAAAPADILTRSELEAARELFSGLSDREIQKLYKKVSR